MSKFDIFLFFCHLSKLFGRVNEDSPVCFVYPASPIFPVFSQKVTVFFLVFFYGSGSREGSTREGVCTAANRLFVFPKGRGDGKVI